MAEITEIQQALVAQGYDFHVDGAVGVQTDCTIRDFQTKSGLESDGIVGNVTRAALGLYILFPLASAGGFFIFY
ncbi:peptidoglycan-binding domain-containing protein [Eubacterium aggregans]|uniref:peptidoglycan-binding domain-containing protein n=1 Tax=Eubacterium aggregans TaxID=81409 RepID=UPI003F30C1E8